MTRFLKGCVASSALGLLLLVAGCAEDNEKTANIQGKAPEAGAPTSQGDMQAQMKGAAGGQPKNYPAPSGGR